MTPRVLAKPSANGVVVRQRTDEVAVTPELAEQWLAKNTHNRNLREARVARYAKDMTAGDWCWNGESIKFSDVGVLLDGQHRLHAIIRADATLMMTVAYGVDPDAQETVDGGIPRAFHDVLALRGEINVSNLAALVRKVASWESEMRRRLDGSMFSNAELFRVLDQHPELRQFAKEAGRCSQGCNLPASVLGLAWWVFAQIDEEDANEFFERMNDGQGLVRGHPIYELRRTLNDRNGVRQERRQMYMLVFTIKAWNAYRDGRELSVYKFSPGGAKPEKFPEPI